MPLRSKVNAKTSTTTGERKQSRDLIYGNKVKVNVKSTAIAC